MKIFDHEYRLENSTMERATDWHDFIKDPVPHVTQRWGARPHLMFSYCRRINDEFWYTARVLERLVQRNPVITIDCYHSHAQIQDLISAYQTCQEPRIIITNQRLPGQWPDWVRQIVVPAHAYLFSLELDRSGVEPAYQKRPEDHQHPWGMMAASLDNGRPELLQMAGLLGLLEGAEYSSPRIPKDHAIYDPDPCGINPHLPEIAERRIGEGYHRFDFRKNFSEIIPVMERCNFWVAPESGLLRGTGVHAITEKALWGLVSGTPGLVIAHPEQIQQLRAWGFQTAMVPSLQASEDPQEAVIRWCKEIQFRTTLCRDRSRAHSWYRQNSPATAHDADLIRRLHHVIDQEIQAQIDQLPPEHQSL